MKLECYIIEFLFNMSKEGWGEKFEVKGGVGGVNAYFENGSIRQPF